MILAAQSEAPEDYNPTITSGCDGKHCKNSSHYSGHAFDFRTRDLNDMTTKVWADRMQMVLGSYYNVLLELDPPHIHVGYHGP